MTIYQYGGRYAVFRDHPELPWLLAVDYGAITLGEWIYDDAGVSIGYRMTGMYYENTYPWVPPEAYTNPSALEGATEAGNHAWNYVQMEDGRWYAIDPTWSDGPMIDYSYFLAGKNTFVVSHEVLAGNEFPVWPVRLERERCSHQIGVLAFQRKILYTYI